MHFFPVEEKYCTPEEQQDFEDQQQQQQTTHPCKVICWVREICKLKSLPWQPQKVHSLRVERQFVPELLSAASYFLPTGETAEDIPNDLNEKVASPQASMKAKKLSKLLPSLLVR